MLINADVSCDFTLSHCRMTTTQPDRIVCITTVHRWTCSHHFCACSSLEAIPAIECVVTFGVFCYVVIFSFCICQILVILPVTYINFTIKTVPYKSIFALAVVRSIRILALRVGNSITWVDLCSALVNVCFTLCAIKSWCTAAVESVHSVCAVPGVLAGMT